MLFTNDAHLQYMIPSLVDAIEEMEYERVHSGIETTPDETSNVFEVFYNYLGRLWVAELLHLTEKTAREAIPGQDKVFRFLYDSLASIARMTAKKRGASIGVFIKLSRNIQAFFLEAGVDTHVKGMLDVSIGRPGSNDVTDRLSRFRNNFAHGSFTSLIRDINEHYGYLEELICSVPGLWEQPFLTCFEGKWYLWKKSWELVDAQIGLEPVEGALYIPSMVVAEQLMQGEQDTKEIRNETSYMSLYPLYSIDVEAKSIVALPLRNELHELDAHFKIAAWAAKYKLEKDGHIDRNSNYATQPKNPFDASILTTVKEFVQSKI